MTELREPLSTLICEPTGFTSPEGFAERIHVYDETLRDGEQMPGVAFSLDQKLALAVLLSDLGVDTIMAAFPASSAVERDALRLVVDARRRGEIRADVEFMTIARATRGDILATARSVADPGEIGILVLSTASDLHLKYKLGRTLLRFKKVADDKWLDLPVEWYRRANLDFIAEHVAFAAGLGFSTVEFASEDASRSDVGYLLEWAEACRASGGTRMCFSDTCGVLTPEAVDHYFVPLMRTLSGFPVTAHFHNDFGLGAVNTVRALSHGATHASMTACGIGERAGNTSLHLVAMILKELYGITLPRFRYDHLWDLRRAVERFSGIAVQPHEPIIGHNVFAHESGIHTAGISIHPAIYQVIDERVVGGDRRFVFGKHSGTVGVLELMARAGISARDPQSVAERAVDEIKRRRTERAERSDFGAVIARNYEHLGTLGLPDEEVLAILGGLVSSPPHPEGF